MNNWVDSETRMHILIRLSKICFHFQKRNIQSEYCIKLVQCSDWTTK